MTPFLLLAALAVGQADTIRWTRPACAECRIVLTRRGELGPLDQRVPAKAITRDSRGRYYVAQALGPGSSVQRFDARGRRLRALGRYGAGPGEYRTPRSVVALAGDTLVVLDAHLRRASLFGPDGRFVRSFQIPAVTGLAEVAPFRSGFVMSAMDGSRAGAGFPLYAFTLDGRFRRWPNARPLVVAGFGNLEDRALGVRGARVWTQYARLRPVVEERDGEGRVRRVFWREASWYRVDRVADLRVAARDHRPGSYGSGVWEDGDGVLWVLWQVADRRWESALEPTPRRSEGGRMGRRIADPTRYWEMYLDAVDARTGVLLATARWDAVLAGFTADGLLVGWQETADGDLVAALARPRLRRPTQSRR